MQIKLADHHDETQLREIMRESAMPGWIQIAFGRDPDFFHAVGVQGKHNDILIAAEDGRIAGMGCRAVKPLYINGNPMNIGYLSGLRIRPDSRRSGLLARGYAALRKRHLEDPVPFYLTTVMEDNTDAQRLLTSGRAGLPHYLNHGRYITHAINLNARRKPQAHNINIKNGKDVGLQPIIEFINEIGPTRQFYPVVTANDFNSNYLRDLRLGDFYVAIDSVGKIAGLAAAWDQSRYKQNIVHDYSPAIKLIRPAINASLKLTGYHGLPQRGGSLKSVYISFICISENNPAIMRAILENLYLLFRIEYHFMLIGFHERDPLQQAIKSFACFRYTSRLYLVCWDDGLDSIRILDESRIPYLELATL